MPNSAHRPFISGSLFLLRMLYIIFSIAYLVRLAGMALAGAADERFIGCAESNSSRLSTLSPAPGLAGCDVRAVMEPTVMSVGVMALSVASHPALAEDAEPEYGNLGPVRIVLKESE